MISVDFSRFLGPFESCLNSICKHVRMSSLFKEGCDKSICESQAQYRTGQNDLHNFDLSQFHKTSAIYLRDPANLSMPIVSYCERQTSYLSLGLHLL